MNWSSEVTQLRHPLSCYFNSSMIEDTPLNSFSSPRAGSVTVIGKRIYSQSCISPSTLLEDPKFPIPIQVFTRIKRQQTQAKKLCKQRNLKIKCQEQPGPPVIKPKPKRIITVVTKKREIRKEKPKTLVNNKSCPKIILKEDPFPAPLSERSTGKMSQIIKLTMQKEVKNKKKLELEKKAEYEYNAYKKNQLEKQNSKIRLENSLKFKMEKFTPKAA